MQRSFDCPVPRHPFTATMAAGACALLVSLDLQGHVHSATCGHARVEHEDHWDYLVSLTRMCTASRHEKLDSGVCAFRSTLPGHALAALWISWVAAGIDSNASGLFSLLRPAAAAARRACAASAAHPVGKLAAEAHHRCLLDHAEYALPPAGRWTMSCTTWRPAAAANAVPAGRWL